MVDSVFGLGIKRKRLSILNRKLFCPIRDITENSASQSVLQLDTGQSIGPGINPNFVLKDLDKCILQL
ncbi:hypothetical protein CEXT_551441 [Caerostris extrusa]|uniref:Uncharacterized protein n=1 Tax=Caerostris extrusa TaxID=172846 RepID=A0AAV4P2Y2_CAEEX|nr:hypothetical protein CEXT_551441 [Caerostris extrusa]